MSSVHSRPVVARPWRPRVALGAIYLFLLTIMVRLFYWQVIAGGELRAVAQNQYHRQQQVTGQRGQLLTADGYLLVGNQEAYRLFVQPKELEMSPAELLDRLAPVLQVELSTPELATQPAQLQEVVANAKRQWLDKLSQPSAKWVALLGRVSAPTYQAVKDLNLHGVGFDTYAIRYYPEASLAAHITGFVGKDTQGEDLGYFGVEGALDKELAGRTLNHQVMKNALGWQLGGSSAAADHDVQAGRDVTLTIRRDVQTMVEAQLQEAIERYGAKSGEIIVMEPSTGKILASAAWPRYQQATFTEYPTEWYKNPSLTSVYEPGSTFKLLTVAAGLDAGVITPDTQCQACDGPRQIGKYTIRTWNDRYNPGITMTNGLAKSDNTAMIYITDLLGKDAFVEYVQRFGIGQAVGLDLQEDTTTPFPSKWGPVELATASFGQGIGTTSMQLLRAVAAIANQGVMMRPQIVAKVTDSATGEEIVTQPAIERAVIKPNTAQTLTEMMVVAASEGEAKWTASRTHTVAGKTGTSQIAVGGSYDPDKTIASFIGFAPAGQPRFVMLVKLVEPASSIWAAETAAPLWYKVARQLYLLLEIPPDKSSAIIEG